MLEQSVPEGLQSMGRTHAGAGENLEKRRLRGGLIAVYTFLKGGRGGGGADLLSLVTSGKEEASKEMIFRKGFSVDMGNRLVEKTRLYSELFEALVAPPMEIVVQIPLSHFNLSSLIHLVVVLMFLSGPTLGYMSIYVTYFYNQVLYLGSNILPQCSSPDGFAICQLNCAARLLAPLSQHRSSLVTTCLTGRRLKSFRAHKKLGGGTARTADPNWPKGYSIPGDVMLSIETGGRWLGGSDLCLGTGWALWWAVTPEGTEMPNLLMHGSVPGVIATDLVFLTTGWPMPHRSFKLDSKGEGDNIRLAREKLRGDVPWLEGAAESEDSRPESSRCAGNAWAQPKSSGVEPGDTEATGAKRETPVKRLKARKGCSSMKETRTTAQLKCLYTNARSMGNKQEELEAIVHQENYDMVAIMETWWGDSHNWSAAMDGYKLFRRDRQGRRGGGVALYVRESLDSLELDDGDDRVECLWVRIRGKANKADIVVGVCYRPPNQDEETDELFYKQLGEASRSLALVLVGDFNLPDVCWKYNTAKRKQSRRFLERVADNFLTQLVSEPTREGAPLDLLFMNRDGLVSDVMVGGCLGQSDHEMIEFLIRGEAARGVGKTATLDFRRADFSLFRRLVERVPWEAALMGKRVQEGWTFFKEEVLKAQERAVPRCRKTSRRGRRPAWLTRELWLELRRKRRVYDLWKKGRATQEDYKGVARLCREKTRRAKAELELSLAAAIKDNKKHFFKYISSKRRGKENLQPLVDGGGNTVTKDEEKAEVLNAFFASVFISRAECSMGTQPLELEDRDGDQTGAPIIQGEMVSTCCTT
ncbi:hypothetical protein QYF61_013193 [Mycteria americana]|uniref:Endonuclease/exonuclease/phosphatase domain-containing protein n=1 Tax=Mycteria americana TaxID=33587 RepID=A0AAN7NNP7_MYCAM|nr:hypothetical protein QYF61_013193 [Mycteria americana]